jgi:Fur family ferric uptake transcriptional regulator
MAFQRLTKQKQEFRRFFELNRDKELTVAEIAEMLKESGSSMGIATVYRAVKRLEAEGILVRCVNGSTSKTRYKYASPDNSVRSVHRVFCTSCGKILDLPYKFTDRLEKSVSDTTGFSVTEHQLMFYGFCPDCRK